MFRKTTKTAFAAMSLLAEAYDEGRTRLPATEIAERRGLQQPFLAKVLTTLAQSRLVEGSRGPGGGFTLTKHPRKIRLHDVFRLFETEPQDNACPFGGGICGMGRKCPLHEDFMRIQEAVDGILRETTFDAFRRG